MGKDVKEFIETGNAFEVMGELKRLNVITKDDTVKAMSMNRADWIKFMKQKAGILPEDEPTTEGGEDEDEDRPVRPCDDCKTVAPCEEVPEHGITKWLCKTCAGKAYKSGDAV